MRRCSVDHWRRLLCEDKVVVSDVVVMLDGGSLLVRDAGLVPSWRRPHREAMHIARILRMNSCD